MFVLSKNSYRKSVITLGNLLKAHFGIFMLSVKNRDTKALLYPMAVYQCQSNECTGANQLWANVAVCVITYETHSVNTAIYGFELQMVLYTSQLGTRECHSSQNISL